MSEENLDETPGLFPSVHHRTKYSISIQWSYVRDDSWMPVDQFILDYNSAVEPECTHVNLSPNRRLCIIDNCSPGTKYSITLTALDINGQVVVRAKPLIAETTASIERPVLKLLHNEPGAIKIGWNRPREYGDAKIHEYHFQVNGKNYAKIIATKKEVTFTECRELRTYTFRIQACAAVPDCDSDFSHILDVTCPGALPLNLEHGHCKSINKIQVAWNRPICQGGARVREYRIYYRIVDDVQQQPSKKDILEHADILHTLAPGMVEDSLKVEPDKYYWAILEAEIVPDGCSNLFTPSLKLHATKTPVSPEIDIELYGLTERLMFGKEMDYLLDKRDRLKNNINTTNKRVLAKGERVQDEEVQRRQVLLHRVEKRLKDLLQTINQYTGTISAVVKWKPPDFDEFSEPVGYRILVNDEIYAENLPLDTKEYCMKLSVEEPSYKISVITLSQHCVGHSKPSETILITTSDFRPVRFFCYFNQHNKDTRWPESGGCLLEDTLDYERQHMNKPFPHKAFTSERLHAASFQAMGVIDGKWEPVGKHFGNPKPTALLFWTKWCASSQRAMEHYCSFAKSHSEEVQFLTCCVFSEEAMSNHQAKVIELMDKKNWNKDEGIQHFCACHPGPNSKLRQRDVENSAFAKSYKLLGVPTLVLIDREGFIAWQGRVFSESAETFSNYLRHTLSVIEKSDCPIKHCEHCDSERYGVLYTEKAESTFTARDLTLAQFNAMMEKQAARLGEESAMIYTKQSRDGSRAVKVSKYYEVSDHATGRDMSTVSHSVSSSESRLPSLDGRSPTLDNGDKGSSSQASQEAVRDGLGSSWSSSPFRDENRERESLEKRSKSVYFQDENRRPIRTSPGSQKPSADQSLCDASERRVVSALPNIGQRRQRVPSRGRPKTATLSSGHDKRSNQYDWITSRYSNRCESYKPFNPYSGASYARNGSVMSFYSRCGYLPKKPFPNDRGFRPVTWNSRSKEDKKDKVPSHREIKFMRDHPWR